MCKYLNERIIEKYLITLKNGCRVASVVPIENERKIIHMFNLFRRKKSTEQCEKLIIGASGSGRGRRYVVPNIKGIEEDTMFNFLIQSFSCTLDDKKVEGIFKDASLIFAKCVFSLALLEEKILEDINSNLLNQTEFISYIENLPYEHPSKFYYFQFENLPSNLKADIAANIEDIFKTTQYLLNDIRKER